MTPCCMAPDIKRFLTALHVVRECQRCSHTTVRDRTWPNIEIAKEQT